jgi:hypothetical protein
MKSDDRAELDRLMSAFKGEVKRLAPSAPMPGAQTKPSPKRRRAANEAGVDRLKAAEAAMHTPTPPVRDSSNAVTESGTRFTSGIAGATSRPSEVDHYDPARGPRDRAHRAFRMPDDARSRGYIEMLVGAADEDVEDYTGSGRWRHSPDVAEHEGRFRAAAKKGAGCGACGKALGPQEPVWRIRRKYDGKRVETGFSSGAAFETEIVVAPICRDCWHKWVQSSRDVLQGPCGGCDREVHVTTAALKSWLAHDRTIYCCERCAAQSKTKVAAPTHICEHCSGPFAPKRRDARFCKDACRVAASREK